jgi:hypothetical protein
MKSLLVWASIALALYGCSKSSGGSTTASSPSEWSLNSTNYKGDSAVYNATSGLGVLTNADPAGNTITVIFYSHPSANGTYTVTDGGVTSARRQDNGIVQEHHCRAWFDHCNQLG